MLEQLVKALDPETRLEVVAFDQSQRSIYSGAARGFDSQPLRQRLALGATDLAAALGWARGKKDFSRVLVVTDGVSTEGAELTSPLARGQRVDVIAVGGIRDSDQLEALAHRQGGILLDADTPAERLVAQLKRAAVSRVAVQVPGAIWVWPSQLDGVQPGQDVLVYARLPKPARQLTVNLSGGLTESHKFTLANGSDPLLRRAAARADIARLTSMMAGAPAAVRAKLLDLVVTESTRERVLCDYTGLLVLQTESDYQRFHIDRHALADVLRVGITGELEVENRNKLVTYRDDAGVFEEWPGVKGGRHHSAPAHHPASPKPVATRPSRPDRDDVRSRPTENDEFSKKHKKKKGAGFMQPPACSGRITTGRRSSLSGSRPRP